IFAFASSAPAAVDRSTLAVVINDADPFSRAVGEYYIRARDIPIANRIHVRIPNDSILSRTAFERLKADLDLRLPDSVPPIAVTWQRPSRAECMSLTSAWAFGFDSQSCAADCGAPRASALYASPSASPFADFGIRPAILVAAGSIDTTKALIDRGIAAS